MIDQPAGYLFPSKRYGGDNGLRRRYLASSIGRRSMHQVIGCPGVATDLSAEIFYSPGLRVCALAGFLLFSIIPLNIFLEHF